MTDCNSASRWRSRKPARRGPENTTKSFKNFRNWVKKIGKVHYNRCISKSIKIGMIYTRWSKIKSYKNAEKQKKKLIALSKKKILWPWLQSCNFNNNWNCFRSCRKKWNRLSYLTMKNWLCKPAKKPFSTKKSKTCWNLSELCRITWCRVKNEGQQRRCWILSYMWGLIVIDQMNNTFLMKLKMYSTILKIGRFWLKVWTKIG